MPRPARRFFAAIALALTLGAAATLALPAAVHAATADAPDVPVAVAPAEGAFVEAEPVVLSWTAVDAPEGYEVSWTTDAGDAGTATTTTTSTEFALTGGSYTWRVRVLPDGDWSLPATFHADVELTTLPMPAEPQSAAPASPRPGLDGIPGGVWVGGALGFSVVFLVVVVIQSRLRREQDA